MNYGGGGDINTSGEQWLLNVYLRKRFVNEPHPVIFDVGANLGDYSIMAIDAIQNAKIFAFEPCAETFHELESFTKDRDGLSIFRLGMSKEKGTAEIYNYTFNGEGASVLASLEKRLPTQHGDIAISSTETVSLTSIDDFCRAEGITKISLLKLDIEGHELSAIEGARESIESGSIDVIQFEFGPANLYSRTTLYDFWKSLSPRYEIFRLLPDGLEQIPYYEEQLEVYLTTNYVAVRKA